MINWDDAAARADLIARVGPAEYNRLFQEHRKQSTVAVIKGYAIRAVGSRFGRMFIVDGTGTGFRTLPEAEAFASRQPMQRGQT